MLPIKMSGPLPVRMSNHRGRLRDLIDFALGRGSLGQTKQLYRGCFCFFDGFAGWWGGMLRSK